jgi:hypothetical protein
VSQAGWNRIGFSRGILPHLALVPYFYEFKKNFSHAILRCIFEMAQFAARRNFKMGMKLARREEICASTEATRSTQYRRIA